MEELIQIIHFPYGAIFCLNLYLVTLFHRITLELYFQMISRILHVLFSPLGMPRKRIVFQYLRSTGSTRKLKPSLGFLKFLSASKILQNPYKNAWDIIKSVVFPKTIIMCTWLVLEFFLSGTQSHFVIWLWCH